MLIIYLQSKLHASSSFLCSDTQKEMLQSVQNTEARLMSAAQHHDHITSVLCSLHWLPVWWQIIFNTAVLVWNSMALHVPTYRNYAHQCRVFKDVLDYNAVRAASILVMWLVLLSKANDRRTIKSVDFIARFYRPIFSAQLELNSTAKFIADNIGR